jgi:hypothetical protein
VTRRWSRDSAAITDDAYPVGPVPPGDGVTRRSESLHVTRTVTGCRDVTPADVTGEAAGGPGPRPPRLRAGRAETRRGASRPRREARLCAESDVCRVCVYSTQTRHTLYGCSAVTVTPAPGRAGAQPRSLCSPSDS